MICLIIKKKWEPAHVLLFFFFSFLLQTLYPTLENWKREREGRIGFRRFGFGFGFGLVWFVGWWWVGGGGGGLVGLGWVSAGGGEECDIPVSWVRKAELEGKKSGE